MILNSFLNIVSVRTYRSELGVILHDNDDYIISLSETSLSKNVQDGELVTEGYKIFRAIIM